MIHVKTHVVARRNARDGRSAQEHLAAALRCLYRRAVSDGLIKEADNPGTEDRQATAPDDHPTVTAWTAGTAIPSDLLGRPLPSRPSSTRQNGSYASWGPRARQR